MEKMNNDILKFIKQYNLSTNKRARIEFDDHRFLLDILRDTNKTIVIQKPTQVGVSFTVTVKCLYIGSQAALNIIYVLPTARDAKDFVTSKFDPIVENSELRNMVNKTAIGKTQVWNSGLKKIGDSYYFFRGAQSESGAQSIDGDLIVNDEYDFQPEETRKMFQERLEGSSSLGYNFCVGYPILKGSGINAMFEESTQSEWFIKCPHCGKEQYLEWPANIDFNKQEYVCSSCSGILSNDNRKNGKWKELNPGAKISGYHISKMMAPWVDAKRIIKSFKEDTPAHFYNYTLGLPYEDKKTAFVRKKFDDILISPLKIGKFKENAYKVMGIDQGDRFQFCQGLVSPKGSVITKLGILNSPDELDQEIARFNPDKIVMDMSPNKWTASALQDKYGKTKFLIGILRAWSSDRIMKIGYYEYLRSEGVVKIERSESLEYLFSSINNREIVVINNADCAEDLYTHLRNMQPAYETIQGVTRKVYKRVGPDDLGHAMNFYYVGCRLIMPESTKIPNDFFKEEEASKFINDDLQKRINKLTGNRNKSKVIFIPPKLF